MENEIQLPSPNLLTSPIEKKEISVCQFAAGIFLKSSDAMNIEKEGVRKGRDIEFIHRMRVASRRLRTALDVFSECVPVRKREDWQVRVRDLTQALGETRDTDVQILLLETIYLNLPDPIFRPGVRRLLLRLRQKRTKLQKKVLAALDSLEKKKVLDQISNKYMGFIPEGTDPDDYSTDIHKIASISISKRLDQFLSYEVYLQNPEYVNELHLMRIAAKQLRYTLEIFAPIYPDRLEIAIKSTRIAQQVLGEIHDCDLWSTYLPDFLEKEKLRVQHYLGHTHSFKLLLPGIEYFQQNREEERRRLFTNYQKTWRKWRRNELWLTLRRTLLNSLPQSENPQAHFHMLGIKDAQKTR